MSVLSQEGVLSPPLPTPLLICLMLVQIPSGHMTSTDEALPTMSFCIAVTKYPRKATQQKKGLSWLTVSKGSIHCGREGVLEQSSSYQSIQQAEKMVQRMGTCKMGPATYPCLLSFTAFPKCHHIMVSLTLERSSYSHPEGCLANILGFSEFNPIACEVCNHPTANEPASVR